MPVIYKVYERLMQKQLISYIDQYLSLYLCGYRNGYSAQHALVLLFEKGKSSLDKHGFAGEILMDLCKAFWHHQSWTFDSKVTCVWLR